MASPCEARLVPLSSGGSTAFIHLSKYRVLICRDCQYAVVPSQIEGHVEAHHRKIQPAQRVQLLESVRPVLPQLAQRPEDVVYPLQDEPPLRELPVHRDGFACTQCPYVCRTIQGIQRHCRTKHQWVNPSKRGGNTRLPRSPPSEWTSGETCQRLFEFPGWTKYFKVRPTSLDPTDSPAVALPSLAAAVRQQLSQRRDEEDIVDDLRRDSANAWLELVRWQRHLVGFNKSYLLRFIHPSRHEPAFNPRLYTSQDDEYTAEQEEALARACRLLYRLIRTTFGFARSGRAGTAAMYNVNRRENGAETNEKPFYSGQGRDTQRAYSQVWVKMLRYLWRSSCRDHCPPYALTPDQRETLSQLKHACADSPHPDQEIMLAFWISMFDHALGDDEYRSGVLSALAVQGIHESHQDWLPASAYTPKQSAVVTTLRSFVLYDCWRAREASCRLIVAEGYDVDAAAQMAVSMAELVDERSRRFMTIHEYGGKPTPINIIHHQRAYGRKLALSTPAAPRVRWDGDRILIDSISFTVGDVRTMVHGLCDSLRSKLVERLLGLNASTDPAQWRPTELPVLDLARLVDNPSELAEDRSFLNDPRNADQLEPGEDWLFERFKQNGRWTRRFAHDLAGVSRHDEVPWDHTGIQVYIKDVTRFKEDLLVLMHFSGGAPARATELLSIRHRNGPAATAQRGLFLEQGHVAMVTTYHKGYSLSKSTKPVHRFLPDEVGELVVYYLWLVQPWVEGLQMVALQQPGRFANFLWQPQPEKLDADGDDEEEEEQALEALGHGTGDAVEDEPAEDDERAADSEPAEIVNVDRRWDTDRVRAVMYRATSLFIGVRLGVARWRQAYPAIQRELASNRRVLDALDDIYTPAGQDAAAKARTLEDVRAMQSAHSPQTEEVIYGLLITQFPTSTLRIVEQYRLVSQDWHRHLNFPSAWKSPTAQPGWQASQKAEQAQRQRRLQEMDLVGGLRRLCLDTTARFHSAQEAAIRAVVEGVPRLLVVMPTGRGKSMVFLLPASASPHGVTIVVVPTVALRQDMKRRCGLANLRCAEWDARRPPHSAQIVLVTPESTATASFSQFLHQKLHACQLERVVIDECHTILEASDSWRPETLRLAELARHGVQLVCLTATLPPWQESSFLEVITIAREDMCIVRESTDRPNISYRVRQTPPADLDGCVQALVQEKLEQHRTAQVIVYCTRVTTACQLGERLDCPIYHARVGNTEAKEEILRRFAERQFRVIVGTSALGLGVDLPSVRAVIHVGPPDTLEQYAQESGRAGRDGQPSEAYVVQTTSTDARGNVTPCHEKWVHPTMKAFLQGKACRRAVLQRYMDHTSLQGDDLTPWQCTPGQNRCDVCQARPTTDAVPAAALPEPSHKRTWSTSVRSEPAAPPALAGPAHPMPPDPSLYLDIDQRHKRRVRDESQFLPRLEDFLREWQDQCSLCLVAARRDASHHWQACPATTTETLVPEVERAMQRVRRARSAPFSGCPRCRLPQHICQGWTVRAQGNRTLFEATSLGCQFPDVLSSAVAAWLVVHRKLPKPADKAYRRRLVSDPAHIEGKDAIAAWFGEQYRHGGAECNNLCLTFWELAQQLARDRSAVEASRTSLDLT